MLVCDVSAIDRLIDMYGENLSVSYKDERFDLYDLRDEFVDKNIECSLDNYTASNPNHSLLTYYYSHTGLSQGKGVSCVCKETKGPGRAH